MSSKHDMYIDYERSFKKRTRKTGKKPGWIILIVMLALGLGSATFYIVKAQMDLVPDTSSSNDQNSGKEYVAADDEGTESSPTFIPTKVPTVSPTPDPTPSAVPVEETEEDIAVIDNRVATKVQGIYVTAPTAGTDYMNDLIELVETTEINAMVIDIKDDHGKISYRMESATANEIGATTNTISDMETLVQLLRGKGIYLIARIVAFKDPYLAEQRQDLAVKNKDGSLFRDNNGEGWVNPYYKDVWDYLVEIATESASMGFDEIQFDYIRFSTGIGISNADFGEVAKDKSKEEIITEFTKYAYEKISPLGVFVSADVYGTIISSSVDAGLVGQNYVEMAKYLDYICPMIYPSHFTEGNYGIKHPDLEPYNIIRKVLTASQEKLNMIEPGEHRAIVRPWLQDFTATWIENYQNYGAEELREQIEGVYSVGYDEWLLWNASCRYSEEGLNEE